MKRLKVILAILLSWFIIHELIIVIDGLKSQPVKSEYGVIFGNTVNYDGSMSERLKSRVNEGLDLYKDSIVKNLFVSGGFGKEGYYEAQVMAEYLSQNGVPKSRITIDNEGNNTWLTASNFKKLKPNCKSVVVVTQYHHLSRSKLAFKKTGVEQVSGSSSDYYELRDFYSLFREFFGYYKYLVVY